MADLPATTDKPALKPSTRPLPGKVYLVPYPKFVFMYPTWIAALVVAIYLEFVHNPVDAHDKFAVAATIGFLGVFFVNCVILAFDFPRATTLTAFFFAAAVALGLALLFTLKPHFLPAILDTLKKVRPVANPTFYWMIVVGFGILFIGIFITARMDWWEVRPNELLHHHGLLQDMERLPSPHVRFKRETNDLFEYLLLGSGRLTLHFADDKRDDVVLDNVLWLSRKEPQVTRMLGVLEVEVRKED